jgi:serine/threonine protein kinase
MGEVYLANDTKLDRKVALKILPPDVLGDQSGERVRRFVQEAKAASALNHPNILTIYEIDEIDSEHFIATEFIDGETLRERIRKSPISPADTLDVAIHTRRRHRSSRHQAGQHHAASRRHR